MPRVARNGNVRRIGAYQRLYRMSGQLAPRSGRRVMLAVLLGVCVHRVLPVQVCRSAGSCCRGARDDPLVLAINR